MKTIATIAALLIVLMAGSAKAQSVTVTQNADNGLVRVYSKIPSSRESFARDATGKMTERLYLLEDELYIFVQNSLTENKLTVWVQKTKSTEAHYLGNLDYDIASDLAIMMPDAFQLNNRITSNVYPQLKVTPKSLMIAKN
jgi:hypothetical protein